MRVRQLQLPSLSSSHAPSSNVKGSEAVTANCKGLFLDFAVVTAFCMFSTGRLCMGMASRCRRSGAHRPSAADTNVLKMNRVAQTRNLYEVMDGRPVAMPDYIQTKVSVFR